VLNLKGLFCKYNKKTAERHLKKIICVLAAYAQNLYLNCAD